MFLSCCVRNTCLQQEYQELWYLQCLILRNPKMHYTKAKCFKQVILYNRVQYLSLLLLAGVEQSVPSTAAIFWPTVRPHLSSNTPQSFISALWLHQRRLALTQRGSEKCSWILPT
jgi:hypothetical protein